MKRVKFTITGMHCASCASNIERAVKKVKGVESVSVSVMTGKAIIESGDNVSIEDLKKAVSSVGYNVVKVE